MDTGVSIILNIILGKEVALFVEKHFCSELLKNEEFKKENFVLALY